MAPELAVWLKPPVASKKVFRNYEEKGNTVSATIPIALKDALDQGLIQQKSKVMIVGFGVGLSWGATILNWDSA